MVVLAGACVTLINTICSEKTLWHYIILYWSSLFYGDLDHGKNTLPYNKSTENNRNFPL